MGIGFDGAEVYDTIWYFALKNAARSILYAFVVFSPWQIHTEFPFSMCLHSCFLVLCCSRIRRSRHLGAGLQNHGSCMIKHVSTMVVDPITVLSQ